MAMNKKYHVRLSESEREYVQGILNNESTAKTFRKRCNILLQLDENAGNPATQEEIAIRVGVSDVTIYNTVKEYIENGLEYALHYKKPKEPPVRAMVTGEVEARIIALACSAPPVGYSRWTVRQLTERVIELKILESVSRETIRGTLKKRNSSRT
jgi:transposase